MRVLDLFSGIGGFSLGLERAGMHTVAFCEIEPYCRAVLKKHWPDVPIYDDVRTLTAARLAEDGIHTPFADACGESGRQQHGGKGERRDLSRPLSVVDVICGGFPCQDISVAGKGAGLAGERSGLWFEYARIIGEVRPLFVIVENVAALLGRGLDRVLGDLAALGYDAEWHCIPASAVGAPHRRDRLWIVAADANGTRRETRNLYSLGTRSEGIQRSALSSRAPVADANGHHKYRRCRPLQMGWGQIAREIADARDSGRTQWGAEPDVGRVAHGIPSRVDRLRSLGNAVVPQIPEMIGHAIMRAAA